MKLNMSKFDKSAEANPIPFDKILTKISKIVHKTMLHCKILKSLSFTFQQVTTKKHWLNCFQRPRSACKIKK